jgi:LacI family gluconate utilization system Gnt-I transcriptional repressor
MSTSDRAGRAGGRHTLQDVAERAGVSPMTASRALRGVGRVDPALAERVREAAAELQYVPDPAARALASARSSSVVVLVPSLANTVFVDLLEAVHEVLAPAGYQVLIGNTHYSRDEEEKLLRNYLAHRPSGMLVTGFERSEAARRLIEGSGVPCVYLMELTTAPGVHCVGLSQFEAGEAVTRHLLERGRRRIGFVAAQLDARTMQRGEGYRSVLQAAGRYDPALELLSPARSSIGHGAALFREFLARHPDADAIFFCNDDLAQGALMEALRLGIRVPEQVMVAGFNDLEGSDCSVPRLTTIRTPRAEIGRRAAAMLLTLMRGGRLAQTAVDVGFELVVRESA